STGANQGNNPYQIIVARNPFGLQPPPDVQKTEAAPPQIALTGISAVFDKKFALFKGEGKNFILAEGQGDDELQIQLLAVDMEADSATIRNRGVVQIITLAKPLSGLASVLEAAKERAALSRARRENEQNRNSINSTSSETGTGFLNEQTPQPF